MDIEGVVIFEASSGIPLYSRMKGDTDPSLFSSFVAAIGHFSRELRFGGLSSFSAIRIKSAMPIRSVPDRR